jgi:hypothetical protein
MAGRSKKHDANAQFAKLQRADDGKKSLSDYEVAAAELRKKTERLKALRLARDAADHAAAPAVKVKKVPARKKAKSGSLSDWLDGQSKDGRNG